MRAGGQSALVQHAAVCGYGVRTAAGPSPRQAPRLPQAAPEKLLVGRRGARLPPVGLAVALQACGRARRAADRSFGGAAECTGGARHQWPWQNKPHRPHSTLSHPPPPKAHPPSAGWSPGPNRTGCPRSCLCHQPPSSCRRHPRRLRRRRRRLWHAWLRVRRRRQPRRRSAWRCP